MSRDAAQSQRLHVTHLSRLVAEPPEVYGQPNGRPDGEAPTPAKKRRWAVPQVGQDALGRLPWPPFPDGCRLRDWAWPCVRFRLMLDHPARRLPRSPKRLQHFPGRPQTLRINPHSSGGRTLQQVVLIR